MFGALQVRKSPTHYGLPANVRTDAALEHTLRDKLVLENIRNLTQYGLVRYKVLYTCVILQCRIKGFLDAA